MASLIQKAVPSVLKISFYLFVLLLNPFFLFLITVCTLHFILVYLYTTLTLLALPGQERLQIWGESILPVPDTGTRVSDNTRSFLRSSIVSFWITPAHSKRRKYHIFRQYWYTRNVREFINTGMFQYLGPEVYFFQIWISNVKIKESTGTFRCCGSCWAWKEMLP